MSKINDKSLFDTPHKDGNYDRTHPNFDGRGKSGIILR